jgi:hypothetical protein
MAKITPPIVINVEDDEDEQAALNAQNKLNQAIATNLIDVLKRIQRLEKLGGKQDYTFTILEALKAFGGAVNLTFLGSVLPDHALLSAARKQLSEKGLIIEVQEKNRKILKLVGEAE